MCLNLFHFSFFFLFLTFSAKYKKNPKKKEKIEMITVKNFFLKAKSRKSIVETFDGLKFNVCACFMSLLRWSVRRRDVVFIVTYLRIVTPLTLYISLCMLILHSPLFSHPLLDRFHPIVNEWLFSWTFFFGRERITLIKFNVFSEKHFHCRLI